MRFDEIRRCGDGGDGGDSGDGGDGQQRLLKCSSGRHLWAQRSDREGFKKLFLDAQALSESTHLNVHLTII